MKDNGKSKGGSLKPEFYGVYADYFVKYIQEMKKEGITIDAVTPQNEPLHPEIIQVCICLQKAGRFYQKTFRACF
jgi:O-glycosyl hydrolase